MSHENQNTGGIGTVAGALLILIVGGILAGIGASYAVIRVSSAQHAEVMARVMARQAQEMAQLQEAERQLQRSELRNDNVDAAGRTRLIVAADGSLTLAGQRVSLDELGDKLRAMSADSNGQLLLTIQTDDQSPFEHVASIQMLCEEFGVEPRVATQPGRTD